MALGAWKKRENPGRERKGAKGRKGRKAQEDIKTFAAFASLRAFAFLLCMIAPCFK